MLTLLLRSQDSLHCFWYHSPVRTPMRLCDFPILTFDTYGTLIDWGDGHLGCAATALRAS